MKKFLFILIFNLFCSGFVVFGQNRSIVFIEKPFTELMSMAKEQDKLIFLDAFTTWCGPCKWMAANIFTRDSIADYYNKTFICAHFDMEKGEGLEVAKSFQVRAYPTLMFINSSGEMVHMRVGAPQKVKDYLEMGTIALTPGDGFIACYKKFQEGNRDAAFMMKYLKRLLEAYLPVSEPLSQYFASLKESDLLSRPNWNIIFQYDAEMDSKAFVFLVGHQKEFEKLYTADSVNLKISTVFAQAMNANSRSRTFTEAGYNDLKQQIRASGFKGAEKVILTGDLNHYQMRGETEKFLNLAYAELDNYYTQDFTMLNQMAWNFFNMAQDKKYLEKAVVWAKKSIALKSVAENNNTCANLMFKMGNKEEAIKYAQKALESARSDNVPTKIYEETLKKFKE